MKKLIFATGNKGKLAEARDILGAEYEIVSPADMGITEEPEETGLTFKENSLLKAEFFHKATGLDCFADDTGLEVDALGGAPGIYSARYATDGHDFDANIDKLLSELAALPEGTPRTARFRCVATLIIGGEPHFFDGCVEGRIAMERCGTAGFGYDPIFIPDAYPDKSFSELGEPIKNAISHRGQSLKAMAEWLRNNGEALGE